MKITFGSLLLEVVVCADCCCCFWAVITSWMETRVLPYSSLLLTGRSLSSGVDEEDADRHVDAACDGNLDRTCRWCR